MKIRDFLVRLAGFCAGVLWSGVVRADPTAILLQMNVDPALLDERALRESVQRELGCPLVASERAEHVGELSIRSLPGSRVSVAYRRTSEQEPLVRVVVLPRDREERTQWIAWLVGNLARDEAADWLSQRRDRDALQAPPTNPPSSVASGAENVVQPTDSKSVQPAPTSGVAHALVPATTAPSSAANRSTTLERRTFNLSLWYKWFQLQPASASMRFTLHLGAGYGRVGAIRGFGFDMLHHRVEHQVQGVAGSFIWTRAPQTHGLAWSTGVVTAAGRLRGAELAWIFAYRNASVNSSDPGIATRADSVSSAGVSYPDVMGVQLAGVGAWNRGTFVGVQGASAFTRQEGQLRGVEMSMGANVAGRIEGAQVAAVNVAEQDVTGVQFGLVNYARRVDGIAIGLVNVASNVRAQLLPWVERDYHLNVGLRYVYRPLTFGYSVSHDAGKDRTRVLFGIGARLQRGRVAMAPSINVGFFVDKPSGGASASNGHENDVRVSLEWEAIPRLLGLLAGPALALQSDPQLRWRLVPRWFAGLSLF